MPEGYFVPEAFGTAELIEKRSRFIGQVWRVESEAEAIEKIRQTRAKYHDARHNCWCYLFPDGSCALPTTGNRRERRASQCWKYSVGAAFFTFAAL
jgi:putative IMPACT (imprinted ancient) family translation regulator